MDANTKNWLMLWRLMGEPAMLPRKMFLSIPREVFDAHNGPCGMFCEAIELWHYPNYRWPSGRRSEAWTVEHDDGRAPFECETLQDALEHAQWLLDR